MKEVEKLIGELAEAHALLVICLPELDRDSWTHWRVSQSASQVEAAYLELNKIAHEVK